MKHTTRQAIQTKYFGPTNTKGARIQAKCAARTVYYAWNYELDPVENHRVAAQCLAFGLAWDGRVIGGGLKDGSYAWIIGPDTQ